MQVIVPRDRRLGNSTVCSWRYPAAGRHPTTDARPDGAVLLAVAGAEAALTERHDRRPGRDSVDRYG